MLFTKKELDRLSFHLRLRSAPSEFSVPLRSVEAYTLRSAPLPRDLARWVGYASLMVHDGQPNSQSYITIRSGIAQARRPEEFMARIDLWRKVIGVNATNHGAGNGLELGRSRWWKSLLHSL